MSEKYEYEKVTDADLLAQLNKGRESSSNGKESSSLAHSYKDYLKGYGGQLFESAAKGGYNLGMLPSYGYEAVTGHPLYSLIKPESTGFIPKSEAGQVGKHAGETVADIASLIASGRLATRGIRALSRYHPLTKGQIGRQFQGPINAAEEANIRLPLDNNRLYELNDLLSHPALAPRGAAGRGLTDLGRHSVVQEAAEGGVSGLHSSQSLLGDLERAIPSLGESSLVRTRIRPLKEHILESIQQGMRSGNLEEEAQQYQQAREGARRHYQTRAAIKKGVKTLSLGALLKMALSGAKNLP